MTSDKRLVTNNKTKAKEKFSLAFFDSHIIIPVL